MVPSSYTIKSTPNGIRGNNLKRRGKECNKTTVPLVGKINKGKEQNYITFEFLLSLIPFPFPLLPIIQTQINYLLKI
jgi:hypothetical protein